MRTIRVLNVLSFTILGCAVMFTDVNAGKKVHIKVHVPKVIKHKHHTNIVFVHKHHHHGGHKKPAHGHHHSHSHGGHHSHGHGEPHGHHHSHSYDHHHHHHITYNHGHGGGHKPHHVGHKPHKPHKPSHPAHKPSHGHKSKPHPKGKHGTHKPITDYGPPENHYSLDENFKYPKTTTHKPITDYGSPENNYSFDENFKYPKTRTQHYGYVTYSPSFEIGDDNKLKELNHTIRHEHTKVETVGDVDPDVESFSEYSKTRTKGSYEVKEEQPFDFYSPEYDPDYGNQNSEYFGKETDDENKDHYSEDYTNPNSVSKYTSAIKHGTIGLENSSYNPDHGNDLEEYINAYKDSFKDN